MKIGIDISALSDKPTGTGRYISTLIECLNKNSSDFSAFSHTREKNHTGIINKIPIIKRGGLQRHIYRYTKLKSEMLAAGVDTAIFPNYFMPPAFQKPSAVIIHDLSFITHPHFYSPFIVKYYRYLLNETLSQKPLLVTISKHSRRRISDYTGISEKDIFLLQSYVSLKGNHNGAKRIINGNYFLFVGHVEPRKNIEFMIRNFLVWKKQTGVNLKLVIAGEIWIKSSSVNYLLKEFHKHPDVIFTGFVDELTLDNLYRNASAFLHTSFEEGFGLPVLEAMSYSLPVLCTSKSATSEISSPQSITIQPDNHLSMLRGLDELYELIQKNSKVVYNHPYSSERMLGQLNLILERLESKLRPAISIPSEKAVTVKQAVEKTLLYASLFKSGLSRDELHRFLLDIKVTKEELNGAVDSLLNARKIHRFGDIYYMNNEAVNIYKLNRTGMKKERANQLLLFLRNVPFIKAIAFSGGTANYGIENHDDLDLFIITRPNTVYIVYLIIHIFSLLKKARKELCVNHLIDEKNLEIKLQQDIFIAHQIISLVPYKNKDAINDFITQNRWVTEYFPNFSVKSSVMEKPSVFFNLLFPINSAIKYLYKFLYRNKAGKLKNKGSVILENRVIKLHTNDHRKGIMELFNEAWKKYTGTGRNPEHRLSKEAAIKTETESAA